MNSRIKETEREFYNDCAKQRAEYKSWREIYPGYLKAPYFAYLQKFPKKVGGDFRILELCCGMGEFSFDISEITQASVLAVDISAESIEICRKQLVRYPNPDDLTFLVSDVETLELPEKSFDIICMSGSLSCIDLDVILEKIKRWLKPEGSFVCVDTYGYNVFFNVKRKLNYLFGKRTKQTVCGIPKEDTIARISRCFKKTEVNFFGIFAFVGPFLKPLIGDDKTARFVNFLDRRFSFLKKYAFKFVLVGKGVRE